MLVDADMIRALPLFGTLAPDLAERVAAISSINRLEESESLFEVGEHPSSLYALRAGQVALGTRGIGEEFVAVEVVRPGDIFAMPAVLLERPSLLGARTLEPSELVCIAAQGLRALIHAEPSFATAMLVSMATAYRGLVRQITDLKSRSVAQRLGCYLLALADEQAATEIVLPFEKRFLASRLGTTPESLSRAFNVLRTCGVSTLGRKVALADIRDLTRFARPDEVA